MESFSDDLLTPPVPLVALVGVPAMHEALSAFLLRQSPPMVTLSLPDIGTAVAALRRSSTSSAKPGEGPRPAAPVLSTQGGGGGASPAIGLSGGGGGPGATGLGAPGSVPPAAGISVVPPPQGILKSGWLRKHRERVPAAVLLCVDNIWLADAAHTEWLAYCNGLDALKADLKSPQAKLIILLIQQGRDNARAGEDFQERLGILKKRAETDARSCVFLSARESAESSRSLSRLFSLLSELTSNFYRDEVRRMRLKVEKRAYTHAELSVRYYFKMAVFHEFRREWLPAVKSYEAAFLSLQEVLAGPAEKQPLQSVLEVKAVGEVITLKICTLLLHTGREVEAVGWFRNYMEWFRSRVGPPEGAFLHWKWMSRQYEVFGELLYQRLAVTGQLADISPAQSALPASDGSSAGPSGFLLLPQEMRASLPQYLSSSSNGINPVGLSTSSTAAPNASPSSPLPAQITACPAPSHPFSSTSSVPGGNHSGESLVQTPSPALPSGDGQPRVAGHAVTPSPVKRGAGATPPGLPSPMLPAPPAPPAIPGTSVTAPAQDSSPAQVSAAGASSYVGPFSSQSLRVPLVARVFQLAAKHKVRYRRAFEAALITLETFGAEGLASNNASSGASLGLTSVKRTESQEEEEDVLAEGRAGLGPPLFIGQPPRILSRGRTLHQQRPSDVEVLLHALLSSSRLQVSYSVIELLGKAHELYRNIQANRMMSHVATEMGREYFHAHDYDSCCRLLDGVAAVYRHESFISLLSAVLSHLRECARQLGLMFEYLAYSLELAALPVIQIGPLHLEDLVLLDGGADLGPPTPRSLLRLVSNTGAGSAVDAPKSSASLHRRGLEQGTTAGGGAELGPAGPPSEEQKRVIAREALGLLRGEREVLPAREGEVGLRVSGEQPFRLSISAQHMVHLRPVLLAAAAFHGTVVKCGQVVKLSLALLTRLPTPLEPLEVCLHFSQPACDVVLEHDDLLPVEGGPLGDGAGAASCKEGQQGSRMKGNLRMTPGKWKRYQITLQPVDSGLLDCLSVSLRLGPHAVLSCTVESPAQVLAHVPVWTFEQEQLLGHPMGPTDSCLSLLGQKSVELEEESAKVALTLHCQRSGLVGERLPVLLHLQSLVDSDLHSLSISVQLARAAQQQHATAMPGVASVDSVAPALTQILPNLERLGAPETEQGGQGLVSAETSSSFSDLSADAKSSLPSMQSATGTTPSAAHGEAAADLLVQMGTVELGPLPGAIVLETEREADGQLEEGSNHDLLGLSAKGEGSPLLVLGAAGGFEVPQLRGRELLTLRMLLQGFASEVVTLTCTLTFSTAPHKGPAQTSKLGASDVTPIVSTAAVAQVPLGLHGGSMSASGEPEDGAPESWPATGTSTRQQQVAVEHSIVFEEAVTVVAKCVGTHRTDSLLLPAFGEGVGTSAKAGATGSASDLTARRSSDTRALGSLPPLGDSTVTLGKRATQGSIISEPGAARNSRPLAQGGRGGDVPDGAAELGTAHGSSDQERMFVLTSGLCPPYPSRRFDRVGVAGGGALGAARAVLSKAAAAAMTRLALGESTILTLTVTGASSTAVKVMLLELELEQSSSFSIQPLLSPQAFDKHPGGTTGAERGVVSPREEGAIEATGAVAQGVQAGRGRHKDTSPADKEGRTLLAVPVNGGKGIVLQKNEAYSESFVLVASTPSPTAIGLGTASVWWQRLLCDTLLTSAQHLGGHGQSPKIQSQTVMDLPKGSTREMSRQDSSWIASPPTPVVTRWLLPVVAVEQAALRISLKCPPVAVLGIPFMYSYELMNTTESLMEIAFQVQDVPSFVFGGTHSGSLSVLPHSFIALQLQLVPITSGLVSLPPIRLLASRFNAKFAPSTPSSGLFVFPKQSM